MCGCVRLSSCISVSVRVCVCVCVCVSVYLHVETSSLGSEAVVRLRGGQQLFVLHLVRLQTQRRTL